MCDIVTHYNVPKEVLANSRRYRTFESRKLRMSQGDVSVWMPFYSVLNGSGSRTGVAEVLIVHDAPF